MSRFDGLTVLDAPVTRRAVVTRGAKLAYAAPLVAASFRLTELTARADEAVSRPGDTTIRGEFPPAIESVSYAALGSIHITGSNLSNASLVTFTTSRGNIKASTRGNSHKGDIEGNIEANTDDQIIVSIPDGLTIFTTTVETRDGTDIFDKKVKPKLPDEKKSDKKKSDEAPQAEEQGSAPAEDNSNVQAEDPPQAEQPVEDKPTEAPPAEEAPATQAPVEDLPTAEPPAAEAPVEDVPTAEPPVDVPPVEETPIAEPTVAADAVETPTGE